MKKEQSEYKINIDIDSGNYSSAFKDFYYNHFVQPIGLGRKEIDTSFFQTMTDEEKEIAKGLIRDNLDKRNSIIIPAAGELKDEKALPQLYKLYETTDDFSWLLTIGRAIWNINSDKLYPELLRKLKEHPNKFVRTAHLNQVTDLQNMESIDLLMDFLDDNDSFVHSLALSKLDFLETGKYSYPPLHDKKYFLSERNNIAFKERLLKKLEYEY